MASSEKKATTVIVPVILCGGSGTRLWPLSRNNYPKQFLKLTNEHSLFQQTLLRLKFLNKISMSVQAPIIVTNEAHRFLVLDQLHQIDHYATIILEPVAKNTAPSLTLAALKANELYDNPLLIVLPADHAISDDQDFCKTLATAVSAVNADDIEIATLGVTPTYAETGYGYIECQTDSLESSYHKIIRFVEKPDLELAQQYIAQSNFYWNSGVFIVRSQFWLTAIEEFDNDIYAGVASAWDYKKLDTPFIRPNAGLFAAVSNNSIDYAVIEPCTNTQSRYQLGMFELTTAWSDLGTWQAVSDYQKMDNGDTDNNVWLGDVIGINTSNCYVHAEQRLVSLLGVDDLIVVDTDDALLIARKSHSQDVKKIVNQLNEDKRVEANTHRKVYRPWGWYQSIDECERFKVKRICVQPKASLSLQKHHHRAEHWVVVKGTAEVLCDDQTMLLSENQSTYIPLGAVHRLSNPGSIPLEMIEVQSGSYLEEDDIIRLEDNYGRG